MIAEKMKPYVKNNSAIRMMFEEGNRLRAIYGADKVYDFSLGNPSVPAPECVKEAIIDLVNEVEPTVLHGYMSNAGFEDVRFPFCWHIQSTQHMQKCAFPGSAFSDNSNEFLIFYTKIYAIQCLYRICAHLIVFL